MYFESFDTNQDRVITRDDLEACLPRTVESHQVIQQLLQQWDMVGTSHPSISSSLLVQNRDGVVSLDDFERYIMSQPDLLPIFAGAKDRVRVESVHTLPLTAVNPPRSSTGPNPKNIFVTR